VRNCLRHVLKTQEIYIFEWMVIDQFWLLKPRADINYDIGTTARPVLSACNRETVFSQATSGGSAYRQVCLFSLSSGKICWSD
jgi:hypothetical protein